MAVAAAWCAALVGCWQETEPGDDGPGDPADPPPLATRTVPVRVRVPDGTPGAVWLDLLRFEDYWTDARVALADTGGGVWTGTVDLQDGALVRYVYDRWDGVEPLADAKDRYEASGDETRIDNRFALVGPGLALDDVVETWQDRRDLRAPLGDLAGVVLDAATGAPLVDAEVSAGGLHTATDVDGRFRLGAIAAGPQRVVVQGTLGEYVPAQVPVTVAATAGAEAGAAATEVVVETTAAEPVDVTFDAALPADTPADAEVRLIGNVYQAGARTFSTFPFHPDPLRAPVADRSTPGHARLTLALHAGTYVEYDWTIGGDGPGREARDQRRSFVVEAGADHEDRTDRVDAWVPDGAHLITWRLTTPPDTTAGAPIAIEMGPSHWMAPTGPSTWTFFMAARPGEQVGYRYVLGGDQLGPDVAGIRRITMPDHDLVLDDAVERWAGTRGAVAVPEGRPIAVTLRAALPTSTSAATPVRALGDGPLAAGVPLVVDAAQPSLRTAAVTVPAGVALHYHYEDGLGGRSPDVTWTPAYAGQASDDAVPAWSTSPLPAGGTRPGYMAGAYLPDYWSPTFATLSAPVFDRLRARGIGWVALSSVWSYGRLQPVPTLEPRPRLAWSVATPREELRAQAALARARGLDVVLAPQWNMELSPGGMDALVAPKSAAWWDAWLAEAERFWLWNASLAEELHAGALLLPGPVFHVYFGPGAYGSPDDERAFDARVRALVAKVRAVYHGKLIISGGVTSFDFPGDADLVGFTTFDLGRPDLPPDATVEQWAAAYEQRFVERVDPLHARWGKPVFAYTVHASRDERDPDPSGEVAQARQLEAIMRAIAARPWIAGSLAWGYTMIDAPAIPSDGVRGRTAEAILVRDYRALTGS